MTQDRNAASVLAISSQVVYGPVGNSAAVPAMRRLGLNVLELPTVVLSNHPGHGNPVRQPIAADTMRAMLDRIADRGWLTGLAAVMTGYFVDAAQVQVAADTIAALKAAVPAPVYMCDPILGDDDTGLYVAPDIAQAIRSRLLPIADIITPNRFELSWLAGQEVSGPASAVGAARRLAPLCLATSIPRAEDRLATMLIDGAATWLAETRRRKQVPHGTGDLLSGLVLAHVIDGCGNRDVLGRSMGALEAVLDASEGGDALDLATGLARAQLAVRVRSLEVDA